MPGTSKSRPSLAARPVARPKVFWTDIEKATIVKRAVDLQQEQPSLSGLALLRAALDALQPDRRRDLIALSQAPWFKRMVNDETKRREMEAKLQDDTVTVLKEHRGQHEAWMGQHEAWMGQHEVWMTQQFAKFDELLSQLSAYRDRCEKVFEEHETWERQVVEMLGAMTQELRSLNALLRGARPDGADSGRAARR